MHSVCKPTTRQFEQMTLPPCQCASGFCAACQEHNAVHTSGLNFYPPTANLCGYVHSILDSPLKGMLAVACFSTTVLYFSARDHYLMYRNLACCLCTPLEEGQYSTCNIWLCGPCFHPGTSLVLGAMRAMDAVSTIEP